MSGVYGAEEKFQMEGLQNKKNGLKKGGSWGLHISMLLPNVSLPPPGISLQVLNLHLKHWYIGIYWDMDAALKTFIIWVQIWNLLRMWLC